MVTATVAGVTALVAAATVVGNGNLKTVPRAVAPFHAMRVSVACDLDVRAAVPAQALTLSGDENIVAVVDTVVEDGVLVVRSKSSLEPRQPLKLTVAVPTLDDLEISGAADGRVVGLMGPAFHLRLSGASKLVLTGEVASFRMVASGASEVLASSLRAKSARVELSGAGRVEVNASDDLDVEVSGVGQVLYVGKPKSVRKKVSGVGMVGPK